MIEIILCAHEVLSKQGICLLVRFHPREHAHNIQRIKNAAQDLEKSGGLYFDNGLEPCDRIIKYADACMMSMSIVFLDCLKYNVPIIDFGWMETSMNFYIKQYNIFSYACNITDLREVLASILADKVSSLYDDKKEKFLSVERSDLRKIETFIS
jgi:hypothetical protein